MGTETERDAEIAVLKQKVAAMEDLVLGFRNLLTAFARTQPKQVDLLPAVVDGTAGSASVALRDALVATFERVTGRKYVFEGARDGAAVKKLIPLQAGLRGELMARWEECLRMKQFPGTQSLAQFVQRINSFGPKAAKQPVEAIPANFDPYASP